MTKKHVTPDWTKKRWIAVAPTHSVGSWSVENDNAVIADGLHEYEARAIAALPELVEASKRIEDDYQTSKTHHPNHILIPIATLEGIRAARAKMEG